MPSHQPRSTFLRGTPYLPVADVSATEQYYRQVLGFTLEYAGGDPPEFAILSRDGCAVMLRRIPDASRIRPMEVQGGTWDAFYWVSAIDPLYEEFRAHNAVFAYGPTLQPYGMKEFAIRDPDGHVIGFGQAVEAGAP